MIYTFNDITIDNKNYQLLKNTNALSVEPQVFNLIVYLIEHRERVVLRQELFDALWAGRVVSDATISNHIKSARKVLGDDGNKQVVIKTIHGRGYQFIAQLENNETPEALETPKTQHSSNKTFLINRKLVLLTLFISVIVLVLWFYTQRYWTKEQYDNERGNQSIAVLAFKDMSENSDQAYFSEGISEELLNLFTKIPDLRVASRTSSFSFKNKQITLEEIGKELNVSYIMEGSVRKSGNKLRITAQLIRVQDGSHIWSETYDHEIQDIFKIQDEIAKAVTQQLKINLSKEELVKSTPVDTEAYALYLQSIYLVRQNTEEAIRKAAQLVGQSISIDPNYAPSWTLMSRIMFIAVIYTYDKVNTTAWIVSKNAVSKALEIDGNYAHAYAQQSLINNLEWDFEASTQNIEKALKLNPTSPTILSVAATNRQAMGRFDESIDLLHQAIKIRRLVNHYYLNLGTIYLLQNKLDKAHAAIKEYDFFFPQAVSQHAIMSFILYHQGKYEQALAEANKEVHEYWKLSALIVAQYGVGNFTESDKLLAQYQEKYANNVPAFFASMHAYRNDIDKAFEWLDFAYEKKDPSLIITISFLPMRKLWTDPRWDVFISKLNLPKGHWLIDKRQDGQ